MRAWIGLGVLVAAFAVAGCGLKGPLYLPEKPGPVTTRPGPAAPVAPATAPAPPPATATETPPPLPPTAGDKTGG